ERATDRDAAGSPASRAAAPAGRDQRRLAWARRPSGRAPARAVARDPYRDAGAGLPVDDSARDPRGQRLHVLSDRGGRSALLRDLPHDDSGTRAPAPSGRRAGRVRALAVLLGLGDTLVVSRQCADLPDLPGPGAG